MSPAMKKLFSQKNMKGFTLIELMVAIGLFAFVMTLSSGAYLVMIGLNRQAQSIATGIDNLSFALESMTRDIRTGSAYNCGGPSSGDCPGGANSFYFIDKNGLPVSYTLAGSSLQRTRNSVQSALTDPSVTVTALTFFLTGSGKTTSVPADYTQPNVILIVSGWVSSGSGGKKQTFTIQTEATMRGSDI